LTRVAVVTHVQYDLPNSMFVRQILVVQIKMCLPE
jgi:hypothetical protein